MSILLKWDERAVEGGPKLSAGLCARATAAALPRNASLISTTPTWSLTRWQPWKESMDILICPCPTDFGKRFGNPSTGTRRTVSGNTCITFMTLVWIVGRKRRGMPPTGNVFACDAGLGLVRIRRMDL